jgi:hypothetical protein
VVSFLVEAVGAYFVASAVKSLGTNIYRAFFSDEEMSDKERGDIVGKGIFDVGARQFRVVPEDYSWNGMGHGMGMPNVPGQPHVHIEFLRSTSNGNFVVVKNVHIPIQ